MNENKRNNKKFKLNCDDESSFYNANFKRKLKSHYKVMIWLCVCMSQCFVIHSNVLLPVIKFFTTGELKCVTIQFSNRVNFCIFWFCDESWTHIVCYSQGNGRHMYNIKVGSSIGLNCNHWLFWIWQHLCHSILWENSVYYLQWT